MKILVTGGAGFIGSHFVRWALEHDESLTLINIDKLTYAGKTALTPFLPQTERHSFVRGDITDEALLSEFLTPDIDAVINFAAESHVDRSLIDATSFIHSNVLGTYRLLQASLKNGVQKFIQISTDEVYGETREVPFREIDPLCPNNPYSASKGGADLMVRAFVRTHSLPAIITRSSNNYGPNQYPEKFLPLMIISALEKKPLPLYGDGKQRREWLHVLDHCEAIWTVLKKGRVGEIYNIGSGDAWENLAVARKILQMLHLSQDLITFVADRPGHDRRYALNTSKIRKALGWRSKRSLEQEIPSLIDWYIRSRPWWEDIIEQRKDNANLNHWWKGDTGTVSKLPPSNTT